MKKLLSIMLILAITICCFGTSVFAESDGNSGNVIPENATKHTIALQLQPEGEYSADVNTSVDGEVSPCIWGDPSLTMVDNHVAYTSQFYVSDRYFAFEMEGFLEGNPVTNEGYCVALQHAASGGIIASLSGHADGTLYKVDWIDIYTDANYRFEVTNGTDYTLTVYITYYSWN